MQCAYCGERFNGRPIISEGETYCSISCADRAAAEIEFENSTIADKEYGESVYDENLELDYYDEEEL